MSFDQSGHFAVITEGKLSVQIHEIIMQTIGRPLEGTRMLLLEPKQDIYTATRVSNVTSATRVP
jgi:hypothetical protein